MWYTVAMEKSDKAVELFKTGACCSQAVFCAFAEDFGMDAETYSKAWSIYQNDDLKADQKRKQLSALGYNGSALYKALGQKLG